MTLYALEYQTASMKEPRSVTFDSAQARALFQISLSTYVLATRRFELEVECTRKEEVAGKCARSAAQHDTPVRQPNEDKKT